MVIKLIALVLAVCSVELLVIGVGSPSDPILLVVSSNPFVMTFRLLFILAACVLAFKTRFKYKGSQKVIGSFGAVMMAIGMLGMGSQTVSDALSTYIKYLDFWIMLLVGLVFTLAALTILHGYRRFYTQKFITRIAPKTWGAKIIASGINLSIPAARK